MTTETQRHSQSLSDTRAGPEISDSANHDYCLVLLFFLNLYKGSNSELWEEQR